MKRPFAVLATVLLSVALVTPALAHEAGQWIIRGGVGTVMPKDDNLTLPEITILDITIDATVQVDDGTSLVLSGTYMFSENWAFDILAAWPFKHDVDLDATISQVGNVPVSGTVPFGEVEHLPPTFSMQYHFAPDADFQPYVGLGVNYTTFLSEDLDSGIVDAGIVDFELDDSFGVAAQVGADWMLNDSLLLNFDVRWISIESDLSATIDDGQNAPVTGKLGKVKIDPWVFAISLGYRF
jgi:outer membrane protein